MSNAMRQAFERAGIYPRPEPIPDWEREASEQRRKLDAARFAPPAKKPNAWSAQAAFSLAHASIPNREA